MQIDTETIVMIFFSLVLLYCKSEATSAKYMELQWQLSEAEVGPGQVYKRVTAINQAHD